VRVALLSFHFAEYAYLLARSLATRHQVYLILNKNNLQKEINVDKEQWGEEGLAVRALPHLGLRHWRMLENTIKIMKILKSFKPDVVHIQEAPKDYLFAAIPMLSRFPCVLTVHDHIPHSGSYEGLRARLCRKYLRKTADAIIVHAKRIGDECQVLFPFLNGKIFVVNHGVLGIQASEYRSDWEAGTALFFGRIERYKGLGVFVRAIKLLAEQDGLPRIRGIIAGRGPDLSQYRAIVETDKHFELIERYVLPDEVPKLFKKSNVVVLPYLDATQSGVAAYALRYGRPMIASNVGGLPEMIRHGHNGFLINPGDYVSLAGALRRLIVNQELSHKMGWNSFRMGLCEFSWEQIALETTKVYEKAIRAKGMNKKQTTHIERNRGL